MSTTPGESTWADAGLVPPDDAPVELDEAAEVEHQPAAPRPDLRGEAEALIITLLAGALVLSQGTGQR